MSGLNLEGLKNRLLSAKDKLGEEFIEKILQELEPNFRKNSADLSLQEHLQHATAKLNDCSVILAHKFQPILKDYIALKEQQELVNQYGIIKAKEKEDLDLAKNYQLCFNAFLNASEDVSVKMGDKDLCKNISPKDAFLLIYYGMATAQRQESDNLPQLAICGFT
jgi:hypothetical protein